MDPEERWKMPTNRMGKQPGREAARIFAVNERMNQMVLEHLDAAAWSAKPPGGMRTIAAIFTHVHNVRTKWVRLTAPHLKVPRQLNRLHTTQEQARAGLAESAARCEEMLAEALGGGGGIVQFLRDGWARPWPVGPEMLCYMLTHEAHHRGQVCMLAHQMGFPLPKEVAYGMWNWEKMWKDGGASRGRGHES
jgi:uncharacterized damage-inducible protein DinB